MVISNWAHLWKRMPKDSTKQCLCNNGNAASGTDCTSMALIFAGYSMMLGITRTWGLYMLRSAGKHQVTNSYAGNSCIKCMFLQQRNAASGTDCTSDGSNICASCYVGHYKNGTLDACGAVNTRLPTRMQGTRALKCMFCNNGTHS